MFRRLFWFTAGIAAGVWATTKANRVVRRLSPDSLAAGAADRAIELGGRARRFADDVRDAMAERERELTRELGLEGADEDTPALAGQHPRPATGHRRRRHSTYPQHTQKEGN
jgi:hypothetical protein